MAPILDSLQKTAPEPASAWAALSGDLKARHALEASASGEYCLTSAGATVNVAVHRDLFGLLLGEPSGSVSLKFLEFLYALAAADISASVTIADVAVSVPAQASEETVIDALARKFSTWDIWRL